MISVLHITCSTHWVNHCLKQALVRVIAWHLGVYRYLFDFGWNCEQALSWHSFTSQNMQERWALVFKNSISFESGHLFYLWSKWNKTGVRRNRITSWKLNLDLLNYWKILFVFGSHLGMSKHKVKLNSVQKILSCRHVVYVYTQEHWNIKRT